ncbi:phosphate starvation-inducible protein PhoH [Albimonas donghaensis]|uniref:PhoH-like protein n=2 Tax=Albimonas donghaensis TaxID=356660 RepID=A0A1H3E3K3_9RHOB|nr:phosphate starvation-inducible protein PhoH [Albimonas donghaensis]
MAQFVLSAESGRRTPSDDDPAMPGASSETLLDFPDNSLLAPLCGAFDRHLAQVEQALTVQILRRGNVLAIHGEAGARTLAAEALSALYLRLEQGRPVEPGDVDAALRFGAESPPDPAAAPGPPRENQLEMFAGGKLEIRTRKKTVEPRTAAQRDYVRALFDRELVFGVGPAGTGKTYLAVAVGVSMWLEGRVDRIILSRPAVEAGERLGFLPGDMKEKIDPYMQPLYDSLNDLLPPGQVQKAMLDKKIEIAPLAFMRGRTLSNAFIVLDEAQNATEMQMKMFLTRLGEGSRMSINGDLSQVDLPRGVRSGLDQAVRLLADVKGVGMTRFKAADVVRHPMVQRIIEAYDAEYGDEGRREGIDGRPGR